MHRMIGILGVGLLAALAGCSSSHQTTASATTSTSAAPPTSAGAPTASSTTAPASSSTSDGSSSATSTLPAGPTTCRSSQLAASLGSANGTAGTIYYLLSLRNTSSTTCLVAGYPGVSFVAGSDGHQVGAAASRTPGTPHTLTLAPGRSASAQLAIVDAANFPSDCSKTAVTGLRVYPPNQRAALFVPHADFACANTRYVTLRIGPLAAS